MIFSPITSKLLRLGRPHVRPSHIARKSWTLAPEEEIAVAPAIFDPEDLQRVTGYSSHSFREQEMARLNAVTAHRGATILSELDNIVICGGNLYAGPYKHPMRDARKLIANIELELPDVGIPCSTWLGGMYFGHWLGDDTPLKLLMREFGRPTEIDFPETAHQAAYNEVFGITRELLPDDCLCRKALLVECDLYSRFRASGWEKMTDRIEMRHPATAHLGCMLLRGESGQKRLLINEREIAEQLVSMGFRVIDPANSTLGEILDATRGARMIVGVEGSQLAHGFHCLRAGGAMVVLQPPDRFGCIDKSRCDVKGVRYAFIVGQQEAEGFRVETSKLLNLIEQVSGALRPVTQDAL